MAGGKQGCGQKSYKQLLVYSPSGEHAPGGDSDLGRGNARGQDRPHVKTFLLGRTECGSRWKPGAQRLVAAQTTRAACYSPASVEEFNLTAEKYCIRGYARSAIARVWAHSLMVRYKSAAPALERSREGRRCGHTMENAATLPKKFDSETKRGVRCLTNRIGITGYGE